MRNKTRFEVTFIFEEMGVVNISSIEPGHFFVKDGFINVMGARDNFIKYVHAQRYMGQWVDVPSPQLVLSLRLVE